MDTTATDIGDFCAAWHRELRITPSLLPLLTVFSAVIPAAFLDYAVALVVSLIGISVCLCVARRRHRLLLFLLFLVSAIWSHVTLRESLAWGYASELSREECHLVVRGRIVDSLPPGEQSRFPVSIEMVQCSDGRWQCCSGMILVQFPRDERPSNLSYGDMLELEGALLRPETLRNVSSGYVRHLRGQGIRHVLYPGRHVRLGRATGIRRFLLGFYVLRERLGGILSEGMSPLCGDLFQTMIMGRKDLFPAEARDHFLRSATLHVFAISGLHVGIVCSIMMFYLLPRLGLGLGSCGIFGGLIALGYVLLTGVSPSSVRAAVMILLSALPSMLHRRSNIRHTLCLAALLELLFCPRLLYHSGFLFSFLAVAALVCGSTPYRSIMNIVFEIWHWRLPSAAIMKSCRWIKRGCSAVWASVLSWLVSTPLTLYLNGIVPVGSVLIAIPVQLAALFLVWGAVIKIILGLCIPAVSAVLGRVLDLLMRCLMATAMLGGMDSFCLHRPVPPGWSIALCLTAVMCLLFFWKLRAVRRLLAVFLVFWFGVVLLFPQRGLAVLLVSGGDGGLPSLALCGGNGDCDVLCCGSVSAAADLKDAFREHGISHIRHLSVVPSWELPRSARLLSRTYPVHVLTVPEHSRSGILGELAALSATGTHLSWMERLPDRRWRTATRFGRQTQWGDDSTTHLDFKADGLELHLNRLSTGHTVVFGRNRRTGTAFHRILAASSQACTERISLSP